MHLHNGVDSVDRKACVFGKGNKKRLMEAAAHETTKRRNQQKNHRLRESKVKQAKREQAKM